MGDYERMCAVDNLERAYRWIQSNPDASYKNLFRDSYIAYAASSRLNLQRLRKSLQRDYEPSHASKVYLPKPSGILRPYTLLTVNDQIVYQSSINIIAEGLKPRIGKYYNKYIFGHLYAGKTSPFFYLKWQNGYREFSKRVTYNIQNGYKYIANFDLASFYDSIDHNVLRHFLNDLKLDPELSDFLLKCLKVWTSSTWTNVSSIIYHGHGIPQSPLSSGLLSEVILQYIDRRGIRDTGNRRKNSVKYLRYVDDIKIFSKTEAPLRQRLISMDLMAKHLGLFPQSSKINIREVNDPYEEIKSVSIPPEPSLTPTVRQKTLRKRLLYLSRGSKVASQDKTRFKYLLSRALPSCELNDRLITLLSSQPELCAVICLYFIKYQKLPKRAADRIVKLIREQEIYHSVNADILNATIHSMQEPQKSLCLDFCYKRLFQPRQKSLPLQPTYKAALSAWVIHHNRLTFRLFYELCMEEMDWWVKKELIKYVEADKYGKGSYIDLLNELIRCKDSDVARCAAVKMINEEVPLSFPCKDVNEAAKLVLLAANRIRSLGKLDSSIDKVFSYILKENFPAFEWGKLLGQKLKSAERIAIAVRMNYESNIDACIVTLDSLCDLIFESLFNRYLPGNLYGNYGAMLKNPTLLANLPLTCKFLKDLHELRLESITAHPRNKKTGKSTRRLKHRDFYKIRPRVAAAIRQITMTV